jgi:uroporphyrinogen-III synthase
MDNTNYGLFSTEINEPLISELSASGNSVNLIPPIVTQKVEFDLETSRALRDFSNLDWLVFTDIVTVDYFIEFLNENEIDLFDLDSVRICAFGETVSDRLRYSEIHADVIANAIDTEIIFNQLVQYIAQTKGEMKVILLKRLTAIIELTERLKAVKFVVNEISNYRQMDNESMLIAKAKALIAGGAFEEIIFSDPVDLVSLSTMFEGRDLKAVLAGVDLSVVNNQMFQMLFENGFKPRLFRRSTN